MILIVADAGPINYLVQIAHIDLLPKLADGGARCTRARMRARAFSFFRAGRGCFYGRTFTR